MDSLQVNTSPCTQKEIAVEKKLNILEEKIVAATERVAAAKREASELEGAVQAAEAAVFATDEKSALFDIVKGKWKRAQDEAENAIKSVSLAQEELGILLAQKKALTGQFSSQAAFEKNLVASPITKHILDSIASVDPKAMQAWDFTYEREKTQKDRVPGLRKKIAKHYSVWKRTGDCRCQVSYVWGDGSKVAACHLLEHSSSNYLREKIYEIEDINDPRNVLMLCKGIEDALAKGRIYFEKGQDDRTYYMRVWDDAVRREPIHDGASETIGDVEGKKLFLPRNVDPPFKRVLNDHAQKSYESAVWRKWIDGNATRPTEYGSPLKDNILEFTKTRTDETSELGMDE